VAKNVLNVESQQNEFIGRQRQRTANNVIVPSVERKNYDIGRQCKNRRPKKCVLQAKTLMISGGNE
jgi:hypothetical protein